MTTVEADIEVVCPGVLEVLSIGKGDLKLSFDPRTPTTLPRPGW